MTTRFKAVLFDWKGTLFYDESDSLWLRHSAESIGLRLAPDEVQAYVDAIDRAAKDPRRVAAEPRSDWSSELNRTAALLLLEELAGLPHELAMAIWQRDGDLSATQPYPDTVDVLRAVHGRGVRIAIVSDIHYDPRAHFAAHGLSECIGAFVLSFQLGCQKPDARMFRAALDAVGVAPHEALMVGDRARRDGGAVDAGITTLLLPPVPNGAARGLDLVLHMVGE
ncbi:MAG TPA: HAD-IA family hydrolase [Chloroflexota bacterium]